MINYKILKQELNNTNLVIVSKKRNEQQIMHYYDLGQRHFGENRAQELLSKIHLPNDIKWHFIGHLQTNKVKYIIPYVFSIDSIDSLELLKIIDKQSLKNHKITTGLIQLNLANEDTKFGLKENEIADFMKEISNYKNVKINGFMCIGPHCDDNNEIDKIFNKAYEIFKKYENEFNLTTLSMGMSNDYKIALKNHSTEVRLGSILF